MFVFHRLSALKRKMGPMLWAWSSPPTPKFLRVPPIQVALVPISCRKSYPTCTHWPTSTQTNEIPSTPRGVPGPRRPAVSLKFGTYYRRNKPENVSDSDTESCRLDLLRGCDGSTPADIWLCLVSGSQDLSNFCFGLW